MKNKFKIIFLIVMALCFMTACTTQQKKIEVYSFSGENDFIEVNNGIIIITDELQKFIGGDLSFKAEELLGVESIYTKFYFYKDGMEETIQTSTVHYRGSSEGVNISYDDLGSTSSEFLFNAEDWNLIKDSLNFSVSVTFVNGESSEYNLVLKVKEV